MVYLSTLDRQRLQRGAEHLHALGAGAQAEFLAELAGRIGGLPATLGLLAEYQNASPVMVRQAGGKKFSRGPMRSVG